MVLQIDNPRGGDAPKVGMLDRIERDVELVGPLDAEQHEQLLYIAAKCPVQDAHLRDNHPDATTLKMHATIAKECTKTSCRASPTKLKVLVFAASLRAESLNRKLSVLAARVAEQNGAIVDLASMRDFDVSSYDGDVEAARGSRLGPRSSNGAL